MLQKAVFGPCVSPGEPQKATKSHTACMVHRSPKKNNTFRWCIEDYNSLGKETKRHRDPETRRHRETCRQRDRQSLHDNIRSYTNDPLVLGSLTLTKSITGVGIGATVSFKAATKAAPAGDALAAVELDDAAVHLETAAAAGVAVTSANEGASVRGMAPTAVWGMAPAALEEVPSLYPSNISKKSGKSRRKKAAMGMAAVSPVATISRLTSWSLCSPAVVLAGWLSRVAPVYLSWEF
jgi:hypothetical protein